MYVGVQSTDGQPLLFSAYFLYDVLVDAGLETWQRFAPAALGALILLELAQIPFAWVLGRRLGRQQQERERLLRYAVESSEAERRRIAGDLHDGVIQDLTGLTFAMDATRMGCSTEEDRSRVIADGAIRLRSSISELRTLMVDLYPPNLDSMGVEVALQELAANLEQHGIAVELDVHQIEGVAPEVGALVFQAAQESIRNVVGHSDARLVRVEARAIDGFAVLLVDDDGRGFNESTLERRREDGHLGLRHSGRPGGRLRRHPDRAVRARGRNAGPVGGTGAMTEPSADSVRVLIADDHAIVRSGLAQLVGTADDLVLVGSARDGDEAIDEAARLRPDVVLMDLSMPGTDGIEATRRIVADNPEVQVLILTSFSDRTRILGAIDAGAVGYLLKHSEPEAILAGIRGVARGGSPIDPTAARILLSRPGPETPSRVAAHRAGTGGAPHGARRAPEQDDRAPTRDQRTHGEGAPDPHVPAARGH